MPAIFPGTLITRSGHFEGQYRMSPEYSLIHPKRVYFKFLKKKWEANPKV